MEPNVERINRILIVGSGAMGSQIGLVCALAGYDVAVQDIDEGALEKAKAQLRSRLERDVEKGRRSREDAEAAFGRMDFTADLEGPAADADFVVEAAVEKLDVKRELFGELDALVPGHAILATNSSTIVSSRLAEVTERPEQVCNMHFFYPPLVMRCVEVVRNPATSDATVETTAELARRIGKDPVVIHKEVWGFVVNRILGAMTEEALALYEDGVASFEDIDTACRTGLGHPMGPFEVMDLSGIDVGYYARMSAYEDSGDPSHKPRASVTEKVERGELGRKTGKGWYEYGA